MKMKKLWVKNEQEPNLDNKNFVPRKDFFFGSSFFFLLSGNFFFPFKAISMMIHIFLRFFSNEWSIFEGKQNPSDCSLPWIPAKKTNFLMLIKKEEEGKKKNGFDIWHSIMIKMILTFIFFLNDDLVFLHLHLHRANRKWKSNINIHRKMMIVRFFSSSHFFLEDDDDILELNDVCVRSYNNRWLDNHNLYISMVYDYYFSFDDDEGQQKLKIRFADFLDPKEKNLSFFSNVVKFECFFFLQIRTFIGCTRS